MTEGSNPNQDKDQTRKVEDRKPFVEPEVRLETTMVEGTAGRYHTLGVS